MAGWGLALAVLLGASSLQAREPSAPPKVEAQHVATTPLAGEPDKVIDIQIYTFPPQSAVPWHIHKDAIEIEYALQGSIMLEEEGKPPYPIAEGKTNILAPNVVHRGWNPSKTVPAKLYVVRIKPKGAPLATLVETPANASGAPAAADYPEDAKPEN
ncbi:hypothetical protein AUC68_14980 [Methyloceanibacter methanicus]|uniref:Cupin type-2 domain-containing protein n=1 Tax=Methyloceanibacter methanicus TaxID=1774968 RepID=A0A1E3W4V9_9HYPH|nr:cupin domain-containing protein [Methyloceanibacter methanicus]ODS00552.1 hypothetical protein AUC68_14980 [Methyloceanibacter methanicus]